MTVLEIVLLIVLWIIIGLWISYKRNWYRDSDVLDDSDKKGAVLLNVVFMPVALLITIYGEYINTEWEKKD